MLSSENEHFTRIQGYMACNDRASAIDAISREISQLTEMLEVREWSDYTESEELPQGYYATFEEWLLSYHCELLREWQGEEQEPPEPGTEDYLDQEATWVVERVTWVEKRAPTEEKISGIVGACAQLAVKYEIPFDSGLALSTAQSFIRTYPSWNASTC